MVFHSRNAASRSFVLKVGHSTQRCHVTSCSTLDCLYWGYDGTRCTKSIVLFHVVLPMALFKLDIALRYMDLEATSLAPKLGPRTPLCPPCVFILRGESFNVRFKMFVLCVITVAGRGCGAELIKPACGGSSANETQCLEPFSRCSGGNAAWKHPVKNSP